MTPIRLLLVDDHVLFRQSLSRLLSAEPDFKVVADCGTLVDALDVLRREPVDLVLLDFDLGPEQGSRLMAASAGAGHAAKVLMVTAGMTPSESAAALKQGATGIFLKQGPPGALTQAIRLVASGATWVDQQIIREMAEQVDSQEDRRQRSRLTAREEQVLQGVFEGLANKEIGARLGASESAVKAILQQLFHKTGVRTRAQLVRIALEGSFATPRKPA